MEASRDFSVHIHAPYNLPPTSREEAERVADELAKLGLSVSVKASPAYVAARTRERWQKVFRDRIGIHGDRARLISFDFEQFGKGVVSARTAVEVYRLIRKQLSAPRQTSLSTKQVLDFASSAAGTPFPSEESRLFFESLVNFLKSALAEYSASAT